MWDKFLDDLKGDIRGRRDRGKELSITSMPHLDNDIWGIQKKKLTIIGARPSQGKSALIRSLTLDFIRQNKNVVVFSWEETKQGFIENLMSLYGLVNNFDIVTGHFGDTDHHEKAFHGIKEILIKNNLFIVEKRGRTIDDFERLCRKPSNVDCVIVDYMQLVSTSGFRDTKQAYDEFLKRARELAKELNCAMIIASQINRSTIQNKQVSPPMMNELKGCIHGDSIVDGKRIEDIVKNNDYFPVTSVGGKTVPSRLIDVGKKQCLKVKTKSGKEIILSTDTQMYNGEWIKSKDLKIGDKIYVKKNMS